MLYLKYQETRRQSSDYFIRDPYHIKNPCLLSRTGIDMRLLFFFALLLSTPIQANQVIIYRDNWGVPHIYASTPAEVMYGFGYAQAEDRLESMLKNYLTATGHMAEAFGPDYIQTDFQQHLYRHETQAHNYDKELSPDIKTLVESFAAGINAFIKAHPERMPQWGRPPQPHQVVALARYLAFQPLIQQADQEFLGKPTQPITGNQWAISAQRSVEDAVLLCIDPFADWHNTFRSYEAHLHGGNLHAFGFAVPGLPIFAVGHNRTLGWSALPGGADGADVYDITLDSPLANRYKYDESYRHITTDTVRIGVLMDNRIEYRTRLYQQTDLGPILQRKDTHAFAYRLALSNEIRQIEQAYNMMTATDQKTFFAALSLAQGPPQRLIYGDVYGNIAYFLSGRIPQRSEFFNWTRPVSGNTSETEWQGVHAQETLPLMLNPDEGWIQDCDASYDRMASLTMPVAAQHLFHTFSYLPHAESPRSHRMRQLLTASSRLTLSEAIAYSQDTYAIQSEIFVRALNIASVQIQDTLTLNALHQLNTWNGRADLETTGMPLYARWQTYLQRDERPINLPQILSFQPIGQTSTRFLVQSFTQAAQDLTTTHTPVFWKEIQQVRRGHRTWPIAGSNTSLRTVQTIPSHSFLEGIFGQSCTTLICFRAPGNIESHSVTPLGQSDDPRSPHYADQAEYLFSQTQLKPTHFDIAPQKLTHQHTLQIP